MLKKLLSRIKFPDAQFRGAPFWAWNSRLDAGELDRQIAILKAMGFGGFFMHARVGLDTAFLSGEWYELVGRCIRKARELGMTACLYDEDRWPSGTAGGQVTREEKYRIRMLVMSTTPPRSDAGDFLGAFAVDPGGAEGPWRRLDRDGSGPARYFCVRQSAPEPWYNGATYVDTLNPLAVERFIELAYDGYAERFSSEFGRTVRTIFTDEPNYRSALFSENANTVPGGAPIKPPDILPWTERLPKLFMERFGYDILDYLPELFLDRAGREFSRVRRDYFELLTEMFVNAYIRTLGSWCEKHHLPLTGHLHWEDTLTYQRHQIGAAMRSYEYMQYPGIDQLTEHRQIFDTAKQCVSVARQLEKPWRLTECYGCTGWDFPLVGHKALGEWQYALGLNFRCPHLAWYSMAGEAKRDFPASIFFQSPWYRQYPVVEDHFARLGAALSEGAEVRNILVIHPIESTWGWKSDVTASAEEKHAEDQKLIDLRNALLSANLDFDYGDEDIMSRRARTDGPTLLVGVARYTAAVIPQLRTIRRTTLELLEKFRAAGGAVFYLGDAPEHVDAVASPEAGKIFSGFTRVALTDLASALEPFREVSITASGSEIDPALHILRRGEKFQTVFLCNLGHPLGKFPQEREPGVLERTAEFPEVEVRLNSVGSGEVVELDLDSGEFHPVDSVVRDGYRFFTTDLPQLGSRLFIESSEAIPVTPRPAAPTGEIRQKLSGDWEFRCEGHNTLVLDRAEYAVDGGEFRPAEFFITIDNTVRDRLGIPRRGGAMAQPYTRKERIPNRFADLTLRFQFDAAVSSDRILLALENPELWTLELNGTAFAAEDVGFWVDPAIRTLRLPPLGIGRNRLVLRTRYHEYHPGVESLFLLGRFGVRDEVIVPPPERVAVGDLTAQGFPFYSENFTYLRRLEFSETPQRPLFLQFGRWRGSLLGVRVNDSPEKLLAWPPYRMELTGLLRPGENTLAVTVYGHRRNAFGPFYLNEASPDWNGPLQFKTRQQETKQLVPFGLLDDPVLTF